MRIFTEREAENFLDEEGFDIVDRVYIKEIGGLDDALRKLGFPLVMKVSGEAIVHKNGVGGVVKNVKNKETALKAFEKFKKIKGFQGVMVQKQIEGKEFLLGIKKTPEFGHVIVFGAGGVDTEKLDDVSFRVCPGKDDVRKMIEEVSAAEGLSKDLLKILEKNILRLCKLVRKHPRITELDVNPLMNGVIVDARIVFD